MRICTDLAPIPVFRETKKQNRVPGAGWKKKTETLHPTISRRVKLGKRKTVYPQLNGQKNETLDVRDSGAE